MNKTKIPDHISKVIHILRFVLIVLVVYGHSSPVEHDYFKCYNTIWDVISGNICSVAVPLFFIFSGYLFFSGVEDFNFRIFFSKLKKRLKTLFVPYMIWSLGVIFILYVFQSFVPDLFTGSFPLVRNFNWKDWVDTLWVNPIQYQFWFIRDLMFIILLTPIIWILIKYCKIFIIAILGILYILCIPIPIPGLSFFSLFYFSLGAYFSINKIDFVELSNKLPLQFILYFVLLISSFLIKETNPLDRSIHEICALVGMSCSISLASHTMKYTQNLPGILFKSEFLIYAFHGIPIVFTMRILNQAGLLNNEVMVIIAYFIVPILIILISIVLYSVMKRFMPRLTNLLTGGR